MVNIGTITMVLMLATVPIFVHAGKGAVVTVCMDFNSSPSEPTLFQVTTKNLKCMATENYEIQFNVSESGSTCSYLGYVESKWSSSGGDTCSTDKQHTWYIGYTGFDSYYSGSAVGHWNRKGMDLEGRSPDTFLCFGTDRCTSTGQVWAKTGDIFVHFSPESLINFDKNHTLVDNVF